MPSGANPLLGRAAVALATAGGLGWMPVAPGTAGSAVGLLLGWLGARTLPQVSALLLLVVTFVGCALVCAEAERALGEHDPPRVVLDEVWGMAMVVMVLPGTAWSWTTLAVAFVLFRAFDTVKPPPLPQLARLRAGWGIMADDLGAAAYTCAVLLWAEWLSGRMIG